VTKHIDLLGLLYLFAGGLSALVAVSLVALGLGALSIALRPTAETSEVAAGVTAGAFLLLALVVSLWAALSALAGRGLRRRRPWARLASIALAAVNLFILPFGTALGVYALWVLVHDRARQEFEPVGLDAEAAPAAGRAEAGRADRV
jgi:hypothetical protein